MSIAQTVRHFDHATVQLEGTNLHILSQHNIHDKRLAPPTRHKTPFFLGDSWRQHLAHCLVSHIDCGSKQTGAGVFRAVYGHQPCRIGDGDHDVYIVALLFHPHSIVDVARRRIVHCHKFQLPINVQSLWLTQLLFDSFATPLSSGNLAFRFLCRHLFSHSVNTS